MFANPNPCPTSQIHSLRRRQSLILQSTFNLWKPTFNLNPSIAETPTFNLQPSSTYLQPSTPRLWEISTINPTSWRLSSTDLEVCSFNLQLWTFNLQSSIFNLQSRLCEVISKVSLSLQGLNHSLCLPRWLPNSKLSVLLKLFCYPLFSLPTPLSFLRFCYAIKC